MNKKEDIFSFLRTSLESRNEQEYLWIIETICNSKESLDQLNDLEEKNLKSCITRLKKGESLFRIFANKNFHDIDLDLSYDVFEPRWDSEVLIEQCHLIINEHNKKHGKEKMLILDLCTGSGTLLLALLNIFTYSFGIGIDLSKDAIKLSKSNAKKLSLEERSCFLVGNMFSALNGDNSFDLIISNPPYIKGKESIAVANETGDPKISLDGGQDGLDFYRNIAKSSHAFLNKYGFLVLEHGFDQREDILSIFAKEKNFKPIKVFDDLQGNPRGICFQSQA